MLIFELVLLVVAVQGPGMPYELRKGSWLYLLVLSRLLPSPLQHLYIVVSLWWRYQSTLLAPEFLYKHCLPLLKLLRTHLHQMLGGIKVRVAEKVFGVAVRISLQEVSCFW